MPASTPPKPKCRWYQFSLRALLLVMLLSCFVFAWIGVRMHKARENRARVAAIGEAVAAIEKLGGEVTSEYEDLRPQTWLEKQFDDPGGADDPVGVLDVTVVKFQRVETTDNALELLAPLTTLTCLYIGNRYVYLPVGQDDIAAGLNDGTLFYEWRLVGTKVTDEGLENLKGLTNLRELDVARTKVTDAGLAHLKELTNLRFLDLWQTNVAGAGLQHLKGMTNLRELRLSDTFITDAGLKHLKGLTSLELLFLDDTEITDAGLKHLKGLTNLELLNLSGTMVTDEGVEKLQQALPNCGISHRYSRRR